MLTICLPCYLDSPQRQKYIEEAIDSVIKQTDNNRELILSVDKAPLQADLNKYKNIEGIKIYEQKVNLGMVKNRNFCVEKASWDWIIIIGDDDKLSRDFCKEINIASKRIDKDCIAISSNYYIMDSKWKVFDHKKLEREEWYINIDKKLYNEAIIWETRNVFPHTFSYVFNKKARKNIAWYKDFGIVTDLYFSYEIFSQEKKKILYMDKTFFYYRLHETNLCGNYEKLNKEKIKLLKYQQENKQEFLNKEAKEYINKEILACKKWKTFLANIFAKYWSRKGIMIFFKSYRYQNKNLNNLLWLKLGILFWKKVYNILFWLQRLVYSIRNNHEHR